MMSREQIRAVARRVIEAHRLEQGLPPLDEESTEDAAMLAIAKAARRS